MSKKNTDEKGKSVFNSLQAEKIPEEKDNGKSLLPKEKEEGSK